jgi:pyruvate dehydrogenase E2 component (dihydrolipoamide acetyltransferase)
MAEIITMPRLSDTMTEGVVAQWLKKVGDKVAEGDILAEIETDKATMEFESFNEGTLIYIGLEEGQTAPVDALLAIIGEEGDDIEALIKDFKSTHKAEEVKETPKVEEVKASEKMPVVDVKKETPQAIPAPVVNSGGRVFISPLAKKLAEEKGINIQTITGTGDNGRIVKRDVEFYNPATSSSTVAAMPFVAKGEESFEEISNSQMRKVIARRLGESKFMAPHYYLNVEFDMENAMTFRKQFNSVPDTKISYNDIIVKATALALKQHSQVNSQWFDDRMRLNHHVHIGVAVAVPDGLLVPVVKFANEMTLQQIGATVKEMAGKARNKKLQPDEMEGSTFTISNLGMFGITDFTSIINQPNSAILSVGAIVEKPVVKNGHVVAGHTMKLTLACDHRTVDGATGAMFLQTLKDYIENPVTMLV